MSKIKSYFAHLSTASKVVTILIPALMLVFEIEGLLVFEFDMLAFMMAVILLADILTHYFCFGGIYSKDGKVQNFYKISPKGKDVYMNVFLVHGIKRILLYFGFPLISTSLVFLLGKQEISLALNGMTMAGYLLGTIGTAFGGYAYSLIGSLISRKWDMVMVSFAIAVWGTSFMMIFNLIKMWSPIHVKVIILVVLIVISVAGTLFVMWYDRKKLEDSYYDEKSFKRNQSGV